MTRLPAGFRVELDPGTRQLSDSVLFGGSPARLMRLSPAGCQALAELRTGPVRTSAAGVLARRLTDAGLAHPQPPACTQALDVTVLIPVRDRLALLADCLAATGGRHPVLVVDDGSADQEAIAATAARHGADLIRLPDSGGPAAARNAGLARIGTDLIAFLDSDCVPEPDWIERLAPHLADPGVGAVAPRIVASEASQPGNSTASRYAAVCGSLDLGSREARVMPATRVSYVPTAALLVRRAALESVTDASGARVFDPALRYGEDVDLVWRLHDAGWRIRYEPGVQMRHLGPGTWPALLGRRFRYGTSAAPLARRHRGRLTPLVLQPWPALTVAGLLARRPVLAVAAATAGWLTLARTVSRAGVPADGAAKATLTAVRQTWLGAGRYATQFAAPALAAALVKPGGSTPARRWSRRAGVASLLLAPALEAWRQQRPALDPLRFTLGHIADDCAYGAGVWAGCVRERTLAPVTPRISWRLLRIAGTPGDARGSNSRKGTAMASGWFESVAEAQRRAKKRLPSSVYDALLAGAERGQTLADNVAAFTELGFAPHVAGLSGQRDLSTTVLGQPVSLPVLIAPTGVQAVHPDGEVAVARAAAARGTAMGLSSFASKPVEEVVAANPQTLFQIYWCGSREQILARLDRARSAGAVGVILTLDWTFSHSRDWGSPSIPERINLRAAMQHAPEVLRRPRWLTAFARSGQLPDLTVPNMAIGPDPAPTFFGAYGQWMQTPPPSWADIAWLREQWDAPFLLKGVTRVDDAKRAVDAGVSAISVSNHGGNNLDGTPATIRALPAVAEAVGSQIEVLLDGGIRRGSDVVKALALGARAVMIGRAYLWGLAAGGQAGVENVLDILRNGLDSALLGLGRSAVHELTATDVVIPPGFERVLGGSA